MGAEINNIKASAEESVLQEIIYQRDLFFKNYFTATSAPTPIAEVTIKNEAVDGIQS